MDKTKNRWFMTDNTCKFCNEGYWLTRGKVHLNRKAIAVGECDSPFTERAKELHKLFSTRFDTPRSKSGIPADELIGGTYRIVTSRDNKGDT